MTRHLWRLFGWLLMIGAMTAVVALASWWLLLPDREVRILVVDKTVPHPTYREHEALFWALNHHKTIPPGHTRPWEVGRDYLGYVPPETGQGTRYGVGTDLTDEHLTGVDLLFLADAYGVYRGDYDKPMAGGTHLDYSELLYGGYSEEEARVVRRFAEHPGRHLVAEFNTFGSPTTGSSREILQDAFNVTWTGWTGRYLDELGDRRDVPHWAPRLYEAQTGKQWIYQGPGVLFVHEDQRIVVLQFGPDIGPVGPRYFVSDPASPLMQGIAGDVPYLFWFDVVEPREGASVLGTFRLDVTESGKSLLDSFGLAPEWPAVVLGRPDALRLYLAGDFSDNNLDRGPYWLSWWPRIAVRFGQDETFLDGRGFFFKVYVPLLGNVLDGIRSQPPSSGNGAS